VTRGLSACAHIAGGDVGFDVIRHTRVIIISRKKFESFVDTVVTSEGGIVMLTEKFQTDAIVLRNVNQIIVE